MNILTQNAKMKKSSQNGIDVYNFGIPAFMSQNGTKTCPGASQCAAGCYARSGTYRFGNVVNAYEERLKLTQDPKFVEIMVNEIMSKFYAAKAKGNRLVVRIHDSGDFYSEEYVSKWYEIMHKIMEQEGTYNFDTYSHNVTFYAYTKSVPMFKGIRAFKPANFVLIYSLGGKFDSLVDVQKERHAKVFETEAALLEAGYVDASQDDMVAALGVSNKVGLVYHGSKKYANTAWNKVS